MKIGILTFQFAHNYGALLQAYALNRYLLQKGKEASIINYIPNKLKNEYSMNPFDYSSNPKVIISLMLRNLRRTKQNKLIKSFQHNELSLGKIIYSEEEFISELNRFDIVSVGSDQVWNTRITGEIENYFLDDRIKAIKIAYAASFGTDGINIYQKKAVQKNLTQYTKISVREIKAKEILEENNIESTIVCDPVFLLEKDRWIQLERKPQSVNRNKRFALIYILSPNEDLERMAAMYSVEENVELYVIHPTAQRFTKKGKQLYDVGPREFIWLIHNAEIIFSNSFHATAFSTIFGKTLIYDSVKGLGSRVKSLFNSLNVEISEGINKYDLGTIEANKINEFSLNGKEFLNI
jgi:hypothetical protein